jgi:hypothetical protein
MEIRVLQGATPVRRITLMCRHHAPQASLLRIRVVGPDGAVQRVSVDGNGEFELAIDCSDLRPQARLVYRVHTEGGFVPAHLERGSADLRSLAFLVDDRLIER